MRRTAAASKVLLPCLYANCLGSSKVLREGSSLRSTSFSVRFRNGEGMTLGLNFTFLLFPVLGTGTILMSFHGTVTTFLEKEAFRMLVENIKHLHIILEHMQVYHQGQAYVS
uniref:Uncharacterized protein n=1 Tax=Trichobilharzia regenti TaxID=157069 RepID=A0AA85JA28_TRIRE